MSSDKSTDTHQGPATVQLQMRRGCGTAAAVRRKLRADVGRKVADAAAFGFHAGQRQQRRPLALTHRLEVGS